MKKHSYRVAVVRTVRQPGDIVVRAEDEDDALIVAERQAQEDPGSVEWEDPDEDTMDNVTASDAQRLPPKQREKVRKGR